MATVTAVVNQKGGVAKTTTTVCLGDYLSRKGKKVLLLDLDPEAHMSLWFFPPLSEDVASSFDLLAGKRDPRESVRKVTHPETGHALENLFLIPAGDQLKGIDLKLADQMGRETMLLRRLESLHQYFDHILIDCPPGLGVLGANALTAAEYALVPVKCETMSLNGLVSITRIIDVIKERLNPNLEILGILPTVLDRGANLGPAVLADVQSKCPYPVFETVIRKNVQLAEAPGHRLTIEEYAPESRGAEDYRNFTDEFLRKIEEKEGQHENQKAADQEQSARLVG